MSKRPITRSATLGAVGVSTALLLTALGFAQTGSSGSMPSDAMPGMAGPSSSPSASPSGSAGTLASSAGNQRQIFTVQLNPLNSNVQQAAPSGTATVIVDGDRLGVVLNAQGLDPNMMHMAHIHGGNPGNRCPTIADDTNHDGIVDVLEGVPAYGPILVPFDGDINSQSAGMTFTPSADANGNLYYVASGSVSEIVKDLNTPPDPPASSGLGHLDGKPFDISQLHIVVHGISASTQLPSSVQTITMSGTGAPVPPQASLPVLCGTMTQVAGPVGAQSPGTAATPTSSPSAGATPIVSPSSTR